ncbi:hypothetical protein R1flu_028906 [Riccia fluitans]|uniref:Uncharacterized protein n=1 Tax=Riccia fluitans TaxID=41844 RepID=A0ABD1XS37_9MARC
MRAQQVYRIQCIPLSPSCTQQWFAASSTSQFFDTGFEMLKGIEDLGLCSKTKDPTVSTEIVYKVIERRYGPVIDAFSKRFPPLTDAELYMLHVLERP